MFPKKRDPTTIESFSGAPWLHCGLSGLHAGMIEWPIERIDLIGQRTGTRCDRRVLVDERT